MNQVDRELDMVLMTGEKVLWSERPDPDSHVRKAMEKFWFGVCWMVVVVLGTAFLISMIIWGHPAAWLGVLWQIPFILVGIYLLCAPLTAKLHAQQTVYLITNERAIEYRKGGGFSTVKSWEKPDMRDINAERTGAFGSVMFAGRKDCDGDVTPEGFIGIRDLDGAVSLLNALRA